MSFRTIMLKQNMQNYAKLHIDSFVAYIRTKDSYIDIAKDVETSFDSSNVN